MNKSDIQTFLDQLASNAAPSFQELLRGIAQNFEDGFDLSEKQMKVVRRTAKILNLTVPQGLDQQNSTADHATGLAAFFNVEPKRDVMKTLFREIAAAFETAAKSLE